MTDAYMGRLRRLNMFNEVKFNSDIYVEFFNT